MAGNRSNRIAAFSGQRWILSTYQRVGLIRLQTDIQEISFAIIR